LRAASDDRTIAAAQAQPMTASTMTEIGLGGALTLVNVVVGLFLVLFVKHLLRNQPL
jgi:hypothetical protein